ncbi:hypothetical protein Nepgr_030910 [Nepenthes gracilis]|uniref:Uncharacterized protein n=1 Tax=Nepenthes gracilis TaxID=150966 RepID=A0AAD3Y4B3_NEPGR|nr:hypothetical protein Nepgr_030910 [Nepenthes gracilis]
MELGLVCKKTGMHFCPIWCKSAGMGEMTVCGEELGVSRLSGMDGGICPVRFCLGVGNTAEYDRDLNHPASPSATGRLGAKTIQQTSPGAKIPLLFVLPKAYWQSDHTGQYTHPSIWQHTGQNANWAKQNHKPAKRTIPKI